MNEDFSLLKKEGVFDINRTDMGTPDRALAGFPYTVQTKVVTNDPTHQPITGKYLSDHAKQVFQDLLDGKTIWQAVKTANETYLPTRPTPTQSQPNAFQTMEMKVKGDPNARLMGVYTAIDGFGNGTESLKNPDGSLAWFMLLPPLPTEPAPSSPSSGGSVEASQVNR